MSQILSQVFLDYLRDICCSIPLVICPVTYMDVDYVDCDYVD